jgi:orotidine-5'-phosphate decarboxylase
VCAGSDVERARARALRTMVPGIRLAGDDANDQARVDTPADAIARGADWLVIGRSVTGADDPERAAAEVARQVTEGLAGAGS